MRILNLTADSRTYTSNAYLVTGTWRALSDVNALVDTGRDPEILESLRNAPTGVGARKLSCVVLTHGHYDHTGALGLIQAEYRPRVLAFSRSLPIVDRILEDGEVLKLGDRWFEVIHTPGHTTDSICLYSPEERILFSGDTHLDIQTPDGHYEPGFVRALERLARLNVHTIYPGHGKPMQGRSNEMIRISLDMVYRSQRAPVGSRPQGASNTKTVGVQPAGGTRRPAIG